MGSRTIDFWLEIGDEFFLCAIEARRRSPRILTQICGCKNQQNIDFQCFCLETQQKTTRTIEQQAVGGSGKVPCQRSFGKYLSSQKGTESEEIRIDLGRVAIEPLFWFTG